MGGLHGLVDDLSSCPPWAIRYKTSGHDVMEFREEEEGGLGLCRVQSQEVGEGTGEGIQR